MMDLVKLGKFINDLNIIPFNKKVKDKDIIVNISYTDTFYLKSICYFDEFVLEDNYYEKSIMAHNLLFSSDQRIMIPNKNGLLGLLPFLIEFSPYFLNKTYDIKKNDYKKLKNKIDRSKNGNGFIDHFTIITKNLVDFQALDVNIPNKKECLSFLKNNKNIIPCLLSSFYEFLSNNSEDILENLREYIKNYNSKAKIYVTCSFNNEYDLINDIFYYYCIFIKYRTFLTKKSDKLDSFLRDKKLYSDIKCSICNEVGITMPSSGSYVTVDNIYSFNCDDNLPDNYRLKLCKKCNGFMVLAEELIKQSFKNNILIIPKKRVMDEDYTSFVKILNEDLSDFKKISESLLDLSIVEEYDFDIAIYEWKKGDMYIIKKFVENYKSYLIKFENITLCNNNKLIYLFDEKTKKDSITIHNIFDLESILVKLFITLSSDDNEYSLYNNFLSNTNHPHLYQIYYTPYKDFTKNLNSQTRLLLSKYKDTLFSFIYELNTTALNKKIINEMFINYINQHVKHNYNKNWGKNDYKIKIRLNEYYMLIKEIWGISMLNKEDILNLKEYFVNYSDENRESIIDLCVENVNLKYYLIGQFIRYIDNIKNRKELNPNTFKNFIESSNSRNLKSQFVNLLKNNQYYLDIMTNKSKLLFELFVSEEELFNERGLSYQDYLLLLYTGYYTTNILKKTQQSFIIKIVNDSEDNEAVRIILNEKEYTSDENNEIMIKNMCYGEYTLNITKIDKKQKIKVTNETEIIEIKI